MQAHVLGKEVGGRGEARALALLQFGPIDYDCPPLDHAATLVSAGLYLLELRSCEVLEAQGQCRWCGVAVV